LSAIVDRLLASASTIKREKVPAWKELVVNLVREVVSSIDPDVRAGRDNMDIRPYVKIKVIPGGSVSESVYIDGVVFRKNVSHKKMGANASRTNPRILLISEGIEFQRADMKLSSMDTLIEQEDKHMELAVQKIMSLKPDIILVGKAIGRKAQELLCGHNVVVMQNVKPQLLERIA
jgi:1-phosphatidylinositol-3-phosphate 5-kinase